MELYLVKKKNFQNNDREAPCTRWVQYRVGCGLERLWRLVPNDFANMDEVACH